MNRSNSPLALKNLDGKQQAHHVHMSLAKATHVATANSRWLEENGPGKGRLEIFDEEPITGCHSESLTFGGMMMIVTPLCPYRVLLCLIKEHPGQVWRWERVLGLNTGCSVWDTEVWPMRL